MSERDFRFDVPPMVLAAGGVLTVVVFALIAGQITNFALDETVIKQSAVSYTSGLPDSLFHDPNGRGLSRLYPLVQSFFFRVWDGNTAVDHARQFNAVLWASTAIPVWLLARRLLTSRWAATGAALLSIVAPWTLLTTALFAENLAYPLFAWSLLAMAWCVADPSPRRDLVVLLSIAAAATARTQLLSLGLCWIVVVASLTWVDSAGEDIRDRLRAAAGLAARRHPATVAAVALALLYALWLALNNTLKAKIDNALGYYGEFTRRDKIPRDNFVSTLVQMVNFGLGTGVLPMVAALAWWPWASRRPGAGEDAERRRRVIGMLAIVGLLVTLISVYSQYGYLEERTEERYYIYTLPLIWIGAFGAIDARWRVPRSWLALALAGFALSVALIPLITPLTPEYTFLAPAGSAIAHVWETVVKEPTGITERDGLAVLAALLGSAAIIAWRRWPRHRVVVWIVLPAVLQLMLTGYLIKVVVAGVDGVPSRTAGSSTPFAFVDRSLPSGATATWVDSQPKPDSLAADAPQRETLFWNQRLANVALFPQLKIAPVSFPLSAVGPANALVDRRTGAVTTAVPMRYVVAQVDTPLLQLAGRPLAYKPDRRFALLDTGRRVRAQWLAEGLRQDGTVLPGQPVRLRAWGTGPLTVTISVLNQSAVPTRVTAGLGAAASSLRLAGQRGDSIVLRACAAPGRALAGALRSGPVPTLITAVTVRHGAGDCSD